MPYEQLIESVEQCAEDKIRGISEKATRDAEAILAEAREKDASIKKKHMDLVKKTVDSERRKSLGKLHEKNRMNLIQAKETVFLKAFDEARKSLSSIRGQADYENFFRKLLKEIVHELEGDEIQLHIDKRDEVLCKKLLAEFKLTSEIMTDITCAGGLNAGTTDGRFIVFDTIESRFERAKVLVKQEVYAALYGGKGGM
jgi:V/A-type H+-transporting ATPase subunit E